MTKINPAIFKAYDVRGVYPTDLNEEVAQRVGHAFCELLKPKSVIVGRDMRVSSPSLAKSLITGITEHGVNVTDIGMVSTDAFYFHCATLKSSGIMVTASHNPKQYNGLKMVKQMPYFIGGGAGMEELKELVIKNEFTPAAKKGKVTKKDLTDEFVAKVLSFCDPKKIKPLKVVVDPCNGMAGQYIDQIFGALPVKLIKQHTEPDGTFPNHGADPLLKENRVDLEERVVKEKADVGFAFDADVDRFFVIDDNGEFVPGDFLTALLAAVFLKKHPHSKIVYDLRASWAVADTVSAYGGTALMNRVGHAYIKRRMADEDAIFGGEVTGHYYFKDFFLADSGLIPAMLVLQLLSDTGQKMSALLKPLKAKYFISGEINTKLASMDKVKPALEKIGKKYEDGNIYHMDGLSVEYKDWHFNLRASNTEPLLRLNLEAKSKELMEQKRDEILKLIKKFI